MSALSGVRIILGAEFLAFRHRLMKRGRVRLAIIAIVMLAAALFVGGGAFTVGAAAGAFLPTAVDSLLVGGFTGLSVLMLVVGFPTVIATFFVGRDLLLLVLAPIRTLEIFIARLMLAITANLLISSILVAVVFGIGAGAGAPVAYYVLALALIFVQVLVITSLQIALMSMVLRWVPARLARDVAAGVAGLSGAGVYLAWNLSLRQSFSGRSRPDFVNLTELIQRVDWLPPAWPGHALSALVAGGAVTATFWVLLTLLLGGVMMAAAAFLYQRTLVAGLGVFGSSQAIWSRRGRRTVVPEAARTSLGSPRGAASPAFAIARKDWLGFRRDVRRLSRLLPALLFPIGYVFAFSRPSRGMNGFWAEVFLVGFMSMFMSSTLATPSIPSERRGFQLLRMAPVTMWQVLRAKVLLTLPPVLVITVVFSVVVSLVSSDGILRILELSLLVIWLGFGFVAIGVAAGGIDPRFDALDDRRAVGLVGTLAGVGGSLGFAVLSVGALALFVFGTEAIASTVRLGPFVSTPAIGAGMWVIGIVLAAVALALVGLLMWLANTRLQKFEGAIANA